MKKYIEELVALGLSYEQAENMVKNIAEESFEAGAGDVTCDEDYGYDRTIGFHNWFKEELK